MKLDEMGDPSRSACNDGRSVLNSKRNRQILAEIVRAYVVAGEPVSSRAMSRSHTERLSPATIRNVMARSRGRRTACISRTRPPAACPPLRPTVFSRSKSPAQANAQRGGSELDSQRAGRRPPRRGDHRARRARAGGGFARARDHRHAAAGAERARTYALSAACRTDAWWWCWFLPGGATRDKIMRPEHEFTQAELDRTADYLNRHYSGWTLEAIRADLLAKLASEQRAIRRFCRAALELCDPAMLESDRTRGRCTSRARRRWPPRRSLPAAEPLRELLAAIEEKSKLVALLNGCIETPEPVHIQIGVKEITAAGEHLSLITAPYSVRDQGQGSLGVLGPMRMQYERAITAVAFVARAFSEALSRS